jgi:cobalamin biosynthesis Mg chelatase CobN
VSTSKDNNTPKSAAEPKQDSAQPQDESAEPQDSSAEPQDAVEAPAAKDSTKKDSAKKSAAKKDAKPTKSAKPTKASGTSEGTADGAGKKSKRRGTRPQAVPGMNPTWWAPVMCTLMVVGLLWIVVFYLVSNGPDKTYPIPGIGYGNLAIGFAMIMAGFLMTTRWK